MSTIEGSGGGGSLLTIAVYSPEEDGLVGRRARERFTVGREFEIEHFGRVSLRVASRQSARRSETASRERERWERTHAQTHDRGTQATRPAHRLNESSLVALCIGRSDYELL